MTTTSLSEVSDLSRPALAFIVVAATVYLLVTSTAVPPEWWAIVGTVTGAYFARPNNNGAH